MKTQTIYRVLMGFLIFTVSVFAGETRQNGTWTPLGPEGGWIKVIVQDPSDSQILYAVHNGNPSRIHKSTDNGVTWSVISQINSSVHALAINPSNSANIFAGCNHRIYISNDGGSTWTTKYLSNHYFYNLCVDPINSDIIHGYGSYRNSVDFYPAYFKSTNGGTDWAVHMPDETAEYTYTYNFAVDPTNSDIVYISGYYCYSGIYSGRVFRSTNGGVDWSDITPESNAAVYSLVIDPTATNKLYGTSAASAYRSTDSGSSWIKTSGVKGNELVMDPNDPNKLYAGYSDEIYRSTDGGVNWTEYSNGLYGSYCDAMLVDHGSSNNIFFGNYCGIFKSTDGGVNWDTSHSGLIASQIMSMKYAPSDPSIMYVSFKNNAVFKTTDAMAKSLSPQPVTWQRIDPFYNCDSVSDFEIDPGDPDRIYALEDGG